MLRFSIRDILWLTALVAALAAWAADHVRLAATIRDFNWRFDKLSNHSLDDVTSVEMLTKGMLVDETTWGGEGRAGWYPYRE